MNIALVSEGTYPYAMGGVSVWCDQLIRGLAEHRWQMVVLTVDGSERPVFAAPPNLDRVVSIPLWGPRPARGPRWPSPTARRAAAEFRSAYEALLAGMLAPGRSPLEPPGTEHGRFLGGLYGLYRFAADGGCLTDALMSNDAVRLTVDAWYGLRPEDADEQLSLADALSALWLIEHMLRPLSAPPVRADLVHTSMNGLSMLAAIAAKWCHGTPVVMSEHGIYLRERYLAYLNAEVPHAVKVLILSFFRSLAGAAYLTADALAPHSAYNRRWQRRFGAAPERMWTMYNGIEPADFPQAVAEPPEPTISFMGRIDPLKDLHTLIRAFALVQAEIPDARLRIFGGTPAGNGLYRDSCQRLIDELGLTGRAVLEGRVERQVDAYHLGSVVALTSISEGFPYTVVEAMACGRPVVCTDVGGVAEAVGDGGFVVPARDFAAVAQACVKLLRDGALRARLGGIARDRVLRRFTLSQSLDAYREIYDRLVPAPSGPLRPAVPGPASPVAVAR